MRDRAANNSGPGPELRVADRNFLQARAARFARACAMASIRKEFTVAVPAAAVWDALRDVGAVHTRLARGFVTDCRLDGGERIVTFANGFVARELIVDVDDAARRLAYSAASERLRHHHASFQVSEIGPASCRVVWVADLLPHEAAQVVGAMMAQGVASMTQTLESHSPAA